MEETKIMICISCGEEIINPYANCPHCGYRYTASESRTCPNAQGIICMFTENPCKNVYAYMKCKVKQEADKNSF